jgi:hypothetical protein
MGAKGEGGWLVTREEIGQLISSMGLVRREGHAPKELYLSVNLTVDQLAFITYMYAQNSECIFFSSAG